MKLLASIAVAGVALTGAFMSTSTPASAHGNHRSCQLGQAGWHYHVYRYGRLHRVACRPSRPSGAYWMWRSEGGRSGWYHNRDRRWR
ncbi:MAG TPA: hypothetical protein PK970_12535 [Hyphomicrobiaceae bacterium]|nr:hypothetical protein [Hyphomicrobiaceae bacterium]